MTQALTYALITPARNEAENLRRLGRSVAAQSVAPTAWMLVDDGSTDKTREVAIELAARHDWVRVLDSPGRLARRGELGDGRGQGRDVLAFNAGVAALPEPVDVVVKLDADVSFEPDYFQRLLAAFDEDPSLGITGGRCLELEDGRWVPRFVSGNHVRGATRAWRWSCFEEIRPLEERLGWDVVDALKATSLGWTTRSLSDIFFYHHRPVGQRDGRFRSWADQGETAWFVGYRFWYLVARSLHRARRDRAALGLVWGYAAAAATRRPRHPDERVRAELHRKQSLRNLPVRIREAAGRRI